MVTLSHDEIRSLVEAALAEDLGPGDVTTLAVVPEVLEAGAILVPREELVLCGTGFAQAAFLALSSEAKVTLMAADGDRLAAGQPILRVRGPARALLGAERVALNFVQRLSGIATLAARFVQAVHGTPARILDTRKTTPGWRRLEKYAAQCGGAQNHRFGLFDMVLIKDNHLLALAEARPDAVTAAVRRARQQYPSLRVEVEADTLEQVRLAVAAGADIVLLDNMPPAQLKAAVTLAAGRAKLEASGGVNLETVRAIAESGVDYISVGALTHSARAVDVALDFEPATASAPGKRT
jgi:nicotinate-nucleotide pyrophosphorylase (carboxylating)